MASIQYGTTVTDVRGSIGGTTFSRNKNGAYSRKRTKNINSNTQKQQVQKSRFTGTASNWKALTTVQQQTFIDQSKNYPYKNRLGITSYYTGFQLQMTVNTQLSSIGVSAVTNMVPPVSLDDILIQGAVYDSGATPSTFEIDMYNDTKGNAVVPADFKLLIQGTSPLTLGVNSPKDNNYRTITTLNAGASIAGFNIKTLYENSFGALPDINHNVFLRIRLISVLTGQRTPWVSSVVEVDV